MKIEDFDIKYKEKGGIMKLKELRVLCYSRSYIAKYFGVTNDAVRQWSWMFFGNKPASTEEMGDMIILNMMEFARNHTIQEYRFAFKGNRYYKDLMPSIKELYANK